MRIRSNGFFSAASSHVGLRTSYIYTIFTPPQHAMCARSMASTALAGVPTWPPARVREWAVSVIGLEDAAHLEKEKIDGKSLLKLRKHELKDIGMPLGSACNLVEAVSKLVSPGVWFVFIAARLPTSALPPASFAPDAPRSPRAALCGFLPLLRF